MSELIIGPNDAAKREARKKIKSLKQSKKGPKAGGFDLGQLKERVGDDGLQALFAGGGIDKNSLKEQFKNWVNSEPSDIAKGRKFFQDIVLVDIFEYKGDVLAGEASKSKVQGSKQDIIITTTSHQDRVYPIAKILAVGEKVPYKDEMKVGDIVELDDGLGNYVDNPEFEEWVDKQRKGQGNDVEGIVSLTENAPPQKVKGIDTYRRHRYAADKLFEEFSAGVTLRLPYQLIHTEATERYKQMVSEWESGK